jgi:hypothetical protein
VGAAVPGHRPTPTPQRAKLHTDNRFHALDTASAKLRSETGSLNGRRKNGSAYGWALLLRPGFSLQLVERRDIYPVCFDPFFRGFLKTVSGPPQSPQLTVYRFGHVGLRSHPDFPLNPFVIRIVRLFSNFENRKKSENFRFSKFRYY